MAVVSSFSCPSNCWRIEPRTDHAREDVGIEGVAVAGEEQRRRARVQAEARTHFLEIAFEPGDGARADGHDAVFLALAESHVKRAAFGVHVGEFQPAKFGAPQARRVKQFEHGAIAHAERIAHVGDGQQLFDFGERQHFLGQTLLRSRQFKLARGIVQDDILPGEPAEEVFERAEPFALRAPAHALAVGLLIAPEPALKGFEDGPRDLTGAREVALRCPGEEQFQGVATMLDGARRVVAGGERFEIGVVPQTERVGRAAVVVVALLLVAAALVFGALGELQRSGNTFRASHSYDAEL